MVPRKLTAFKSDPGWKFKTYMCTVQSIDNKYQADCRKKIDFKISSYVPTKYKQSMYTYIHIWQILSHFLQNILIQVASLIGVIPTLLLLLTAPTKFSKFSNEWRHYFVSRRASSASYTSCTWEKHCFNWFKVGPYRTSSEHAVFNIHFRCPCAIAAIFVLYYLPSPVCRI